MSLKRQHSRITFILYLCVYLLPSTLGVAILEGNSVYADVNSKVILTCNATAAFVQWKFEEKTLAFLSGGNVNLVDESQVLYEASVNGSNFVLTIKNLKQTEVGKYYCDSNGDSDSIYVGVRVRLNQVISSYASPDNSGVGRNIVLIFPDDATIKTNLTCSAFNVWPAPTISWSWKFAGKPDGNLKTIKTDRPEASQESTIKNFSSTLEIDEDALIEIINNKEVRPGDVTTILNQLDVETISTVITGNLTEDFSASSLALLQSDLTLSDVQIEVRCSASQLDVDIEESFLLKFGSKYNSASQKRHKLHLIFFSFFLFWKNII